MTGSHTDASPLAATVAPEDLACGQVVAVLNETHEYPSFLWCDSSFGSQSEPVRIRFKSRDGGVPLKVKAICLPFVVLENPWGEFVRKDVRISDFVRLDEEYAKTVRKCLTKRRDRKLKGHK